MMNHKAFLIQTLTPLHVGSGDASFGIIDNLIQRDTVSGYPTIHSSSLKGALREYFSSAHKKENGFLTHIFGSESTDKESKPGSMRFYEGWCLALPLRSQEVPYVLALSHETLSHLNDMLRLHRFEPIIELDPNQTYSTVQTQTEFGDLERNDDLKELKELLEYEHIAVVSHKIFDEISKNLPVIARNKLENGKSVNLFYEEVVPRRSYFYTFFSYPTVLNEHDQKDIQNYYKSFFELLSSNDPLIQLGANGSIGYGMCRFKEIR